jgi:hypothetical protein
MADLVLIEQFDQAIERMLSGLKDTASADRTLLRLMQIAATVRDFPDEKFKARLSRELQIQAEAQRRTPMTTTTSVEPTTADVGIRSVMPFICVPDGDGLIEFMKNAFGAEEVSRHPHHGPDAFVATSCTNAL